MCERMEKDWNIIASHFAMVKWFSFDILCMCVLYKMRYHFWHTFLPRDTIPAGNDERSDFKKFISNVKIQSMGRLLCIAVNNKRFFRAWQKSKWQQYDNVQIALHFSPSPLSPHQIHWSDYLVQEINGQCGWFPYTDSLSVSGKSFGSISQKIMPTDAIWKSHPPTPPA